jgi:hypothetical protein
MAQNSKKYPILGEKPKRKRPQGRLVLNRMIILKRSLKEDGRTWTAFIGLRMGTRGGPCEHVN